MGGISTKEEIVARLDELDKKELEVNLKLRDLQIQLNKMLPEEERLKVNENLGKSGGAANGRGKQQAEDEGEE